MDYEKYLDNKKILFLLGFAVASLIALNINFSKILGVDNQFFTLYQFFAPITGMILGPIYGAISILLAEAGNFFIVGREFTLLNLFRILPMIFAAYYFGSKKKEISVIVPLIAMAVFIAHPIGRQVWFFSLFWLIPVIARLMPENLFARSIGATFAAHAVGGAYWIWLTNMEAQIWVGLIPVVMYERLLFAGGIAVSYLVVNTVLDKYKDALPKKVLNIDPTYILNKKFFSFKV